MPVGLGGSPVMCNPGRCLAANTGFFNLDSGRVGIFSNGLVTDPPSRAIARAQNHYGRGPEVGVVADVMSEQTLQGLIGKTALGDRAAFASLYDETSAKLFGVCLRILKDRAQAEDAVQEVYVRIWRRAGSFRAGQASAMAWLVTIARNQSIDMIRSRQPASIEFDDAPDVADEAPDPEAQAALSAEGRRIDACLKELDADRAAAVVGAYVEGSSYQELADRNGVPLNTMRTWLRRSLIKLRECLNR